MDFSGSSSRRPQPPTVTPTTAPMVTQRTHKFVIGTTYKATWHPYQTRIRVAQHLNNCLLPRLDEIMKFVDPSGNVHNVAVNIHDGRQWFEDGVLQMMQFYNLHSKVQIHYTYTINNFFHLRICRPHGVGEIHYNQPPQVDPDVKEEPQEIIKIDDDDDYQVPRAGDRILWTTKITKAIEGGRQGLVLPVTIVTSMLQEDQNVIQVKLSNDEIKAWMLLWNTKIAKHCRLGQGWHQYCRQARLQAGEELSFWNITGAQHLGLQLKCRRQ